MNQYHREYSLQKKFGLSPEEYDEMFERLGNFKDNRRLLAQAIVYLEDHA